MAITFGAQVYQERLRWDDLLAAWMRLDRDSNFDKLWLTDHFITGFGTAFASEGEYLESWTTLAALAQATSRVRLGILVSGNTYRHPAVLAKQATTVDHISGGRLDFAIGAAWHSYEHQALGIPFPGTRERLERLDEAVQVIKLLWTQDRPAFHGRYYNLDAPPYNPPNVQQPHPPILVGGSGEKRTLKTVASYADVTNLEGTPDEIRRKFGVLERHCADVGRDYSSIRRSVQLRLVLTEDPDVQERVIQGVIGLRRLAGHGEPTPDEARSFLLMGSTADVRRQLTRFVDAGAQEFMISGNAPVNPEEFVRFSEEVIPHFK